MRFCTLLAVTGVVAALIVGCGSSGPTLYDKVTTASGLQYQDLVKGTGATPRYDDDVTVHATGWLTNGRRFDTTSGGDPREFTMGQNMAMPGWEEALLSMQAGGTRRVTIPSYLGYGADGNDQLGVPANATLIYELQLVSVTRLNWVTTATGLRYVDLTPGTGPTPETGQTCFVHYTGWLANGTQFDSSHGDSNPTDEPWDFVLGQGSVIAGWDEGVATMNVGSKRRMIVPPELAYGEDGNGTIPPNATLTFEIELIRVE